MNFDDFEAEEKRKKQEEKFRENFKKEKSEKCFNVSGAYSQLEKNIRKMPKRELSKKLKESGLYFKVVIPFMGGRPERETTIGHDDFVNLQIAFGTTQSIDEFIKVV
jgi:hypothetical protein